MATTNFTTLLGLALPTTGDLNATWGDEVNNSITALLDHAIAGTTTLSADADATLTTTDGAANEARAAIINCTGARTAARTITAPAQSKVYIVLNATTGGYAVTLVGAGPTTGVSIANGEKVLVAWNGSDFVKVSPISAAWETFMATPTSANLRAVLSDETGTGSAVFATSPTLVTPVLGTPTSGTLTNCTADGTNLIGYRNIPQNSQSAAYTTVAADAGKHLLHPTADVTARVFTIDSNANVAYPIGTAITFVNQNGAGVITIAIASDTMRLAGAGTTGSRTLAANSIATALKIATTEWIISGSPGLT